MNQCNQCQPPSEWKVFFWISVSQASPRDNPPRCKTSSALHHITWQQKSSWDQRGKRLLVSQHRLVNVITLRCYNKGFRAIRFNVQYKPLTMQTVALWFSGNIIGCTMQRITSQPLLVAQICDGLSCGQDKVQRRTNGWNDRHGQRQYPHQPERRKDNNEYS